MDNHRGKNIMDCNGSMHSSGSNPPMNFVPILPFAFNHNHQVGDVEKFCHMKQLEQTLENFWKARKTEICNAPSDTRGQHMLPLARIKKVMKSDGNVKMISANTPLVFAKACEFFIMELTLRAWMITQNNKRRTLQRGDIAKAIREDNILNFLADTVQLEMNQETQEATENQHGMHVSLPELIVTPNYPDYMASHQAPIDPRLAYSMNLHNLNYAFSMKNQNIPSGCLSFQAPPPAPSSIDEINLNNISKWTSADQRINGRRMG